MSRGAKRAKIENENKEPEQPTALSVSGVDLDREREDCMRRNQQRLQELGLLAIASSLNAELGTKVAARKVEGRKRQADRGEDGEELPNLRRSLRSRGQQPELPPLLENMFRRPGNERPYAQPPAARRAPSASEAGGDAAKFDAHNLHRLRTMSDEAMLKRIHKITNTLKLKSLVGMLREFGRDELADEAQSALDELLAAVR